MTIPPTAYAERAALIHLRVQRLADEAERCETAERCEAILREARLLRDALGDLTEEYLVSEIERKNRRAARPWWRRILP